MGSNNGGVGSVATGVTAGAEQIVGSFRNEGQDSGFVWDAENGLRDWNDVLVDDYGADLSGLRVTNAVDISDDGRWLTGTTDLYGGFVFFLQSTDAGVPNLTERPDEPTALFLGFHPTGVSADGDTLLGRDHIFTLPQGRIAMPGLTADLSADGRTVVGNTGTQAWVWTCEGGVQWLGVPAGASEASVHGVSPDGGTAVGSALLTSTGIETPLRWSETAGFALLDTAFEGVARDTTDGGAVIVGDSSGPERREAFQWTPAGGFVPLPHDVEPGFDTLESLVFGISDTGDEIAGETYHDDDLVTLVRWTAAGVERLESGLGDSFDRQMEASGDHVAFSTNDDGDGFLWSDGLGSRPLGQVLSQEYGFDIGDLDLYNASGVGDGGNVLTGAAFGDDTGDFQSYSSESNPGDDGFVFYTPEPGRIAGLAAALGLLAALRRRRSR